MPTALRWAFFYTFDIFLEKTIYKQRFLWYNETAKQISYST